MIKKRIYWTTILLAVSGILTILLNVGMALVNAGTILASVSWNGSTS